MSVTNNKKLTWKVFLEDLSGYTQQGINLYVLYFDDGTEEDFVDDGSNVRPEGWDEVDNIMDQHDWDFYISK